MTDQSRDVDVNTDQEVRFLEEQIKELTEKLNAIQANKRNPENQTSDKESKPQAKQGNQLSTNSDISQLITSQIQILRERSQQLGWTPILSDEVRFKEVRGPSGARRLIPIDAETADETFGYKFPRIQRFLKQAIEFDQRRDADRKLTKSSLAKDVGLSRYELRHMLKLLQLAPEIKKFILDLPPSKKEHPITKRKLRKISMILNHDEQRDHFCELLSQAVGGSWMCELGRSFRRLDDVDHSSN